MYARRSFRQRVTSPTTTSPTYEVDSPTSNVISPTQGHFYPYTHINIPRSFIHCRAKQTAKHVYPELNAMQLIPRSFIHCQAKRKSILDIASRSDWRISFGERWQIDFIRWRTGRWRSDSLAKRPVFNYIINRLSKFI